MIVQFSESDKKPQKHGKKVLKPGLNLKALLSDHRMLFQKAH